MRLLSLLATALWLSFGAAALSQQETADSAKTSQNSSTEAPSKPTATESSQTQSSPVEPTPAVTVPSEIPPPAQAPAEATPAQKPAASAEKKQTVARKKHRKRTPAPSGTPRKVVVREGGAREPAEQIAPGVTPAEAARQRQNVEQWLDSTDGQLKQLSERKLNTQQDETLGQIRNYMDGARGALREGDVRRASTLAEKAHLLSDDMVKH